MAELDLTTYTTIMELNNREHKGKVLPLINVLAKKLDIIKYASWMECNDGTSHKDNRAATEPTGTERAYDEGIPQESPTSEPYEEPTCMLDGYMKVDARKMLHRKNPGILRMQMVGQYMAGMSKTFINRVFYGDRSTDGKRINGISTRTDYNTLSSPYVIDNAGGNASVTQNKTSIYVIGFGDEKVSFIYPDNDAPNPNSKMDDPTSSIAGIKIKDFGERIVYDGNNKPYPGLETWLELHFGLAIHHPGYIIRIANISCTNIDGIDDFGFDEHSIIDALNLMPDTDNAVICVPRVVRAQMRKRTSDKPNLWNTFTDPFGKNVAAIDNVPIALVEEIKSTAADGYEETVN